MKKLMILAASAFLSLAPAPPALADTYTVTLTGNQYAASGGFNISHGFGDFNDVINFTLPGQGSLVTFFSSIALSPATDIDFTSASLNGTPLTISNSGFLSYGTTDAPAGTTTSGQLIINGTSGSLGNYAGTISFAAAVPESASWVMLVAGLGLVGGVARSRARRPATLTA